jgi:hypothetical protein
VTEDEYQEWLQYQEYQEQQAYEDYRLECQMIEELELIWLESLRIGYVVNISDCINLVCEEWRKS